DESLVGPGDDFLAEACRAFVTQSRAAPDETAFEKSRAYRQVGLCHAHQIVEGTARMADLQPKIPQGVEHRFNDLFDPAGLFPGREKSDVDIRMGRHLTAAVTAHPQDRDPLASCRVADRIEALRRKIISKAQYLVDQERLRARRFQPARW